MTKPQLAVLAVGATGSIGQHVIDEAIHHGHSVRALVRVRGKFRVRSGVDVVVDDLTRPQSLGPAVEGIDAVVFTHGSMSEAEAVDYGGVRNVLAALKGRQVRIALMTAIGVTDRKGAHDWKRRAERLVRASGHPYTIVRPGWFTTTSQINYSFSSCRGTRGSPVRLATGWSPDDRSPRCWSAA